MKQYLILGLLIFSMPVQSKQLTLEKLIYVSYLDDADKREHYLNENGYDFYGGETKAVFQREAHQVYKSTNGNYVFINVYSYTNPDNSFYDKFRVYTYLKTLNEKLQIIDKLTALGFKVQSDYFEKFYTKGKTKITFNESISPKGKQYRMTIDSDRRNIK